MPASSKPGARRKWPPASTPPPPGMASNAPKPSNEFFIPKSAKSVASPSPDAPMCMPDSTPKPPPCSSAPRSWRINSHWCRVKSPRSTTSVALAIISVTTAPPTPRSPPRSISPSATPQNPGFAACIRFRWPTWRCYSSGSGNTSAPSKSTVNWRPDRSRCNPPSALACSPTSVPSIAA